MRTTKVTEAVAGHARAKKEKRRTARGDDLATGIDLGRALGGEVGADLGDHAALDGDWVRAKGATGAGQTGAPPAASHALFGEGERKGAPKPKVAGAPSPVKAGARVPSTMVPFRITMSAIVG